MPWYRKLHWQIIVGLTLGLVYGVVAAANGWGKFTEDWIGPFGTIFINSLQLIAVPHVLTSLDTGLRARLRRLKGPASSPPFGAGGNLSPRDVGAAPFESPGTLGRGVRATVAIRRRAARSLL